MKKILILSLLVIATIVGIKIYFYPSVSKEMFCDNFALNGYAFGMAHNTLENKQRGYESGYSVCLDYLQSYRGMLDLGFNKIYNSLTIDSPSPWIEKIQRKQ